MLHDDGVWQHPLVAATFGDGLRDRLRAAAGELPAYLDEVLRSPTCRPRRRLPQQPARHADPTTSR